MLCKNCGKEIDENDICPFCGFVADHKNNMKFLYNKKFLIMYCLGIIFIILFAFLNFFYFKNINKEVPSKTNLENNITDTSELNSEENKDTVVNTSEDSIPETYEEELNNGLKSINKDFLISEKIVSSVNYLVELEKEFEQSNSKTDEKIDNVDFLSFLDKYETKVSELSNFMLDLTDKYDKQYEGHPYLALIFLANDIKTNEIGLIISPKVDFILVNDVHYAYLGVNYQAIIEKYGQRLSEEVIDYIRLMEEEDADATTGGIPDIEFDDWYCSRVKENLDKYFQKYPNMIIPDSQMELYNYCKNK